MPEEDRLIDMAGSWRCPQPFIRSLWQAIRHISVTDRDRRIHHRGGTYAWPRATTTLSRAGYQSANCTFAAWPGASARKSPCSRNRASRLQRPANVPVTDGSAMGSLIDPGQVNLEVGGANPRLRTPIGCRNRGIDADQPRYLAEGPHRSIDNLGFHCPSTERIRQPRQSPTTSPQRAQ